MSGGPVSAVLAAVQGGAASVADIARRTGLAPETVRAAMDHLTRMGRLEAVEAPCGDGGCSSCPSGAAGGAPGCGSTPAAGRGPRLVALTVTRRPGA